MRTGEVLSQIVTLPPPSDPLLKFLKRLRPASLSSPTSTATTFAPAPMPAPAPHNPSPGPSTVLPTSLRLQPEPMSEELATITPQLYLPVTVRLRANNGVGNGLGGGLAIVCGAFPRSQNSAIELGTVAASSMRIVRFEIVCGGSGSTSPISTVTW